MEHLYSNTVIYNYNINKHMIYINLHKIQSNRDCSMCYCSWEGQYKIMLTKEKKLDIFNLIKNKKNKALF